MWGGGSIKHEFFEGVACVYVHVLVPFSGLRCGALTAHDLTLRVTVGVSNTQLKGTFLQLCKS